MKKKLEFHFPRVGMRMGKTMLSVLIILIVYSFTNRNACFACIGAVYGMGRIFSEGKASGLNRFVGTILGGLLAIPFVVLYHQKWPIPGWVWMALGLFCVLYLSQLLGVNGSIQPGTVVFCVVMLIVPEERFLAYTFARILDTGIGVALSLGISRLWPNKKEQQTDPEFFLEDPCEIEDSVTAD